MTEQSHYRHYLAELTAARRHHMRITHVLPDKASLRKDILRNTVSRSTHRLGLFKRRKVQPQPSSDPDLLEFERSRQALARNRKIKAESLDQASPNELAGIADWMRERYAEGHHQAVWERPVAMAYGLPRDRMSQQDYFWTNAYGAMAGLELREKDHPMVATSAGLAEQSLDRSDADQVEAVQQISRRYFG